MPPKHRAKEHADQADEDADVEIQTDKARDDQADAGHLGDQVGERAGDRGDDADDAREIAAIAGAEKVRNRVGAELAQVGAEKDREQEIATGPTHDVGKTGESLGGKRAGHRDKRRGRHPVRTRGHAVEDSGNAATSDVVLIRVRSAGDDADDDVDAER